ncbi:MAG: hypothetical protein MUP47_09145 [Phycisphaerae bacterium]|nr:hypothetical protein [Phycisphaerae bacterium]
MLFTTQCLEAGYLRRLGRSSMAAEPSNATVIGSGMASGAPGGSDHIQLLPIKARSLPSTTPSPVKSHVPQLWPLRVHAPPIKARSLPSTVWSPLASPAV